MAMLRAGTRVRQTSIGMHCMLAILIFYCWHGTVFATMISVFAMVCCAICLRNNFHNDAHNL
jgi:uncharacterized membrane protein YgaE (UPF0421/DUF939 family)